MKNRKITIIKLALFLCIISFFILILSTSKEKELPHMGMVSLTFDDGLKSHYESVFPLMNSFNYRGTEYILANWSELFEGRELMTIEQARLMQEQGWEVGSHSLDHKTFPALSIEEINFQLQESKLILEREGIIVSSFAYPYGRFNNSIVQEVEKYYSSARTLDSDYNNFNWLSRYNLKSKSVKKDTPPEQVCNWIKKAKENNYWLILTFHYVGETAEKPWDVSLENFKRTLKCINETNIEVKTITEGINTNEKRN